jgi:hypothetical protein
LDITANQYGQFDIVLALGLLYHVADPYRALVNCAALSRDRLLIESYCIDASLPPALTAEPVMRFISDPQRFPQEGRPNMDRSNFWGFTAVCLHRLVEDVGFAVRRTIVRKHRVLIEAGRVLFDDSATRRHIAYDVMSPIRVSRNPGDPSGWHLF